MSQAQFFNIFHYCRSCGSTIAAMSQSQFFNIFHIGFGNIVSSNFLQQQHCQRLLGPVARIDPKLDFANRYKQKTKQTKTETNRNRKKKQKK